jgi:hypothetical protein
MGTGHHITQAEAAWQLAARASEARVLPFGEVHRRRAGAGLADHDQPGGGLDQHPEAAPQ